VIVGLTLKEPLRGHSEPGRVRADGPPPPLSRVWSHLLQQPAFRHLALGAALISLSGYGVAVFLPPYLVRAFGLDYAQAGLVWGLVGGVSAGVGTLLGGPLCDGLARRDARWYAWVPA